MSLLKIVVVPVGEKPIISTVENELSSLQKVVGGLIEIVYLTEDLLLICNEEGKLIGMEGNRKVGNDIITGNFFVVAEDDEGNFIGLTDEQINFVMERFKELESFSEGEVLERILMKAFF